MLGNHRSKVPEPLLPSFLPSLTACGPLRPNRRKQGNSHRSCPSVATNATLAFAEFITTSKPFMSAALADPIDRPDVSKGMEQVSPEKLARYFAATVRLFDPRSSDHPHPTVEMRRMSFEIASRIEDELGELVTASGVRALGLAPQVRGDVAKAADALNFILSKHVGDDGRIIGEYACALHASCQALQWLTGSLIGLEESLRPTATEVSSMLASTGTIRQTLVDFAAHQSAAA